MRLRKASGLVGHWKFNEKQGTVANDSSRYKNHGSLGGGVAANIPVWTEKGLRFDGVNDYVDTGNAASLNITNAITIEAWIFAKEAAVNYAGIVTKSLQAASIGSYALHQAANGVRFSVYTSSVLNLDSIGIDVRGTYHHIVGVYDMNNSFIYIDGTLNNHNAKTGNIVTSGNTVRIGGWINPESGLYDQVFNGSIADVRIYNRALSAGEIKRQYNAEKHNYI